jgi:hypothetical protein
MSEFETGGFDRDGVTHEEMRQIAQLLSRCQAQAKARSRMNVDLLAHVAAEWARLAKRRHERNNPEDL